MTADQPQRLEHHEKPRQDGERVHHLPPHHEMSKVHNDLRAKTKTETAEHVRKGVLPDTQISHLGNTLTDAHSTSKQKLQAAEQLSAAGKDHVSVTDKDGTKRDLRLETEKKGGKTMVHVYAEEGGKEHAVLRGVDDGKGNFSQEKDAKGKDVAFEGSWWGQNMTAKSSLTVSGGDGPAVTESGAAKREGGQQPTDSRQPEGPKGEQTEAQKREQAEAQKREQTEVKKREGGSEQGDQATRGAHGDGESHDSHKHGGKRHGKRHHHGGGGGGGRGGGGEQGSGEQPGGEQQPDGQKPGGQTRDGAQQPGDPRSDAKPTDHQNDGSTKPGEKGSIDRSQFDEQLKDPRVMAAFAGRMQKEVGGQGYDAKVAFAEEVCNRASSRNETLMQALSGRYYGRDTSPGSSHNAEDFAIINKVHTEGTDTTHGATGNASGSVGFGRGGIQTAKIHGEKFGMEESDLRLGWKRKYESLKHQ